MRVRKWLTLMMALALALSLLIPASAGTVAATDPLPGSGELVSKTATFTITEDPAERFMIGNDVVAKFHISVESGDATPIRAFSFCLEATGLTLADDVAANNAQFYYAYPTLNDLQAMYTKVEYTPGTKYFACGGSAETGITNTAKEVLMIMAKVTGDGEHKLSIVTKDTTDPSRVVVAGQSEGTTADQFIRVVNNWALDYAAANTVTGTVSYTEAFSNTVVKIDDKTDGVTLTGSSFTITGVAPGPHTITVEAVDGESKKLNGRATITVLGQDVNAGEIKLAKGIRGDVNGDGNVNAQDRTILARHLAGWAGYETLTSPYGADVNGDGNVNAQDRTILARHLAGWAGYETLG